MRKLFVMCFVFFSASIFSQKEKIKALEDSVSSSRYNEPHYGVKYDKAFRLLSFDKYNGVAIFYLVNSYQHIKQQDSISYFFNKLIEDNPTDIEPYLIRERFWREEKQGYTSRINNFKKALQIKPN